MATLCNKEFLLHSVAIRGTLFNNVPGLHPFHMIMGEKKV
jgi:hypothetical protein